jgi:hypothetical protein
MRVIKISDINGKGYIEFFFTNDNFENAAMEAIDKYEKIIKMYKILDSINTAERASGCCSRSEIDEEIFQEQRAWHNLVFQ